MLIKSWSVHILTLQESAVIYLATLAIAGVTSVFCAFLIYHSVDPEQQARAGTRIF